MCHTQPRLTPLSPGIIVCCELSEGETKEYCPQGQALLCEARGLGPSPLHSLEPQGSSSKILSGIFCVPVIPIQSWPGQGFQGEEDTEKMESFSSGKIERDINAIVNSKPRLGGRARTLVLCLWGLCNSINIDA